MDTLITADCTDKYVIIKNILHTHFYFNAIKNNKEEIPIWNIRVPFIWTPPSMENKDRDKFIRMNIVDLSLLLFDKENIEIVENGIIGTRKDKVNGHMTLFVSDELYYYIYTLNTISNSVLDNMKAFSSVVDADYDGEVIDILRVLDKFVDKRNISYLVSPLIRKYYFEAPWRKNL